MEDASTLRQHRLLTRLTTIKLAVQLLGRKANLSEPERRLVDTALEASDRLTADILDGAASSADSAGPQSAKH